MANFHTISAEPGPAAAIETPPAGPGSADSTEAPDPAEFQLEGAETEPETPPEPEGLELDESAEYLIDGKLVKGKDLLAGRLMREDYTRKTQELAEERKAHAGKLESLEDEKDDLISWAEGLQNPARMEVELEANFPQAFAQLKERIIEDALRQAELEGKPELRYYLDARKAELEAEARKAAEDDTKRTNGRKHKRAEVARMSADFAGWTKSSMEAAGLDPADPEMRTAVQDRLIAAHKGEKWTAETFATAAKHVGKLVKAKAPEPKTDPEAKPALPPVRPQGNRPKPAERIAAQQAARKAAAPKTFDQLRKNFGAQ